LITPELDQPDHEDQSLQAIEEPTRIIDAIKILRIKMKALLKRWDSVCA
jgi:hypothetical protein